MTAPGRTVREAGEADLSRLSAIRAVSLPERAPRLLEYGVTGPPLVLVAEATDPVGYAMTVTGAEDAYLAELAVAPDDRGEGHGRALVEATVDRVGRHDRLELATRADDGRARAFYRACGFRVVETLPDRYEAGDGVLFSRPL